MTAIVMQQQQQPTSPTPLNSIFGPYTPASYDSGFAQNGSFYMNAEITYPADLTAPQRSPVIVLIYGFGGSRDSAFDTWRPLLVSNGYTVIEFDPAVGSYGGEGVANDLIVPPLRALGAIEVLGLLKAEQSRVGSPVYGRLNLGKSAVLGHSFGGCAALLAASSFKTVVALSPCNALPLDESIVGKDFDKFRFPMLFGSYEGAGDARCLLLTGDKDTIALPADAVTQFKTLPPLSTRALGMYKEGDHVFALLRNLEAGNATEFNLATLSLQWLAGGNQLPTPAFPQLMSRWEFIRPQLNAKQTTILVSVLGGAVLLSGLAALIWWLRTRGV